MSLGLMFWIIMFLWAIFGIAWNANWSTIGPYGPWGNFFLGFVLFLLLGWKVFGAPVHG